MANTLKLGAGKWATGKDTVLSFNDENNNFKPLPFNFSRASSATVVNQSGLIATVGSGEPRIDFLDNTEGALLLEPQRTNLILYSQDFSNASWNTSSTRSVDFAPTSTTDPEGKTNAYRVISTASNNQVAIFGSIISGQVYTNSIYVRRVSGSGNIILRNVNNEENNFQLSVSDGWKRIETTATSTSTFGRLYINLQTVGDVIEIWGGQVEQGSYPTSYIPTSGSAVTRVAETCNNGANEQVINSTEGVLYFEGKVKTDTIFAANCIAISDGTDANRLSIIMYGNINSIRASMNVGGVSQFDFNLSSGYIQEQYYKIAVSYKANDCKLFINGAKILTDTSATMPSLETFDRLNLDLGQGLYDFYGNAKDVKLYNTALTEQELAALTS